MDDLEVWEFNEPHPPPSYHLTSLRFSKLKWLLVMFLLYLYMQYSKPSYQTPQTLIVYHIPVNIQPSKIRRFYSVHYLGFFRGYFV